MNLMIRPVQVSDIHAIHRIRSQEHVMPYIASLPSDRIEQLEERYQKLGSNHHEFVAELDIKKRSKKLLPERMIQLTK
jgi:putative acetyltransferase